MVEGLPDVLQTGVDDLIAMLQNVDRVAMDEAAKRLNISMSVLQSWADFLVEERILGIEYKFTKPFIYLNKEKKPEKTEKKRDTKFTFASFKEEFVKKAKSNNIPDAQVDELWRHHLDERLDEAKDFFFREAKKRSLMETDALWEAYKKSVLA